LTTADKTSLVSAINEVKAATASATAINDADKAATTTYSSNKIESLVTASVAGIVDGSPAALDTLKELATALGNDANFAASTAAALGNRVRVDAAQAFTAPQQLQGRTNIGAQAAAEIGNPDQDFAADYTTAKTAV
jgi:hypothetical protein